MKNGNEVSVREIMMSSPVMLRPNDSLQLAGDLASLGRRTPFVDNGKLLRA